MDALNNGEAFFPISSLEFKGVHDGQPSPIGTTALTCRYHMHNGINDLEPQDGLCPRGPDAAVVDEMIWSFPSDSMTPVRSLEHGFRLQNPSPMFLWSIFLWR